MNKANLASIRFEIGEEVKTFKDNKHESIFKLVRPSSLLLFAKSTLFSNKLAYAKLLAGS